MPTFSEEACGRASIGPVVLAVAVVAARSDIGVVVVVAGIVGAVAVDNTVVAAPAAAVAVAAVDYSDPTAAIAVDCVAGPNIEAELAVGCPIVDHPLDCTAAHWHWRPTVVAVAVVVQ